MVGIFVSNGCHTGAAAVVAEEAAVVAA